MSETATVVRALFDRITTTGTLSAAEWQRFKQQHSIPPEQVEAVLLATVQHVLTLTNEIQQEANRLAHALSRRG